MTNPAPSDLSSSLPSLARALQRSAEQLGLPRLGEQLLEETRRRVEHARLRVLVLGEIKQGKSTLINALLGEPLLPTGVTPTTGAVVQLVRGDPPGAWLAGPGDAREALAPERFAQLARGKQPYEGNLVVTTASSHLPEPLELLDTPGINDVQRFRTLVSRGELPRGDALVLVLDATQVLRRTELAFLRDALVAVGGLGDSGAALLIAINRIDLVPEAERASVLSHIKQQLVELVPGAPELFETDAKAAAKDPTGDSHGVREVLRLRARLHELADQSRALAPTRARAYLLRNADLLAQHAAIQARALRLEQSALQSELDAVQKTLIDQRLDVDQLRATIATERAEIVARTREHLKSFRGELQAAILKQLDRADLRTTADILPTAAQDALMHFVYTETERLRLSLEKLTRDVIHTTGEQAQRRLAQAMLTLGFRGPLVELKPPSVLLEASTLAVGVAGTAIMYFGNVVAGLMMTIAAPLATMALRERSVRELRANARESVPGALASAFDGLERALLKAVDDHVVALNEFLVLAHAQLGEQLQALLRRALAVAGEAPAALPGGEPPVSEDSKPESAGEAAPLTDARKAALSELRTLEHALAETRAQLVALPAAS